MTTRPLLDTHIALWLDNGDDRLRPPTLELIEDCWRKGGTVLISAVTEWEIAQLVFTDRISLDCLVEAWIKRFTDHPGIEPVPLSQDAAARAYQLQPFEYQDPADRLLIATAIEQGCSLVTHDARIARFSESHGAAFGFAAVS